MKISLLVIVLLFGCATQEKKKISDSNIKPGTTVKIGGKEHKLSSGSLKVGQNFIKKAQNTGIDFKFKNKVTVVSIVPSIDTPTCEAQTHILGETEGLEGIELVTISSDLPMAQKRFAKEAKLENISYFSDYKFGKFGSKLGLKIKGPELLTRGVVVLDKDAKIHYMQFVDEIVELPNMRKAFEVAKNLNQK